MSSIVMYNLVVIIAATLAFIFQKNTKKLEKLKFRNYIPYIASLLILLIFVGFRSYGTGVDDWTYKKMFEDVNTHGAIIEFQKSRVEPGFLLLLQTIGLFTKDFQAVILISSLISLIYFYAGMLNERKNANFLIAFLLFGYMIYPYYFGIIRLSLAFSVTFFATKLLMNGQKKKYAAMILFASLFHYSAILLLLLAIIKLDKLDNRKLKQYYISLSVIIPLIFILVKTFLIPIAGERYLHYGVDTSANLSISDFDKLPIILLCLFFQKSVSKNNLYTKYLFLYSLALIISVSSAIIDLGRVQWYFNIYICYLLPILTEQNKRFKESRKANILIIPLVIIYGVMYSHNITSRQANIVYFDKYENTLIEGEQ